MVGGNFSSRRPRLKRNFLSLIIYMNKYSLWLIPGGDGYKKFTEIINQLSVKYHAPKFELHISLVGKSIVVIDESEIVTRTKRLASLLHPFSVKLNGIEYTDATHKALFVECDKNEELLTLHNIAEKVFEFEKEEYLPHLSLIYGAFNKKEKEEMMKEIKKYPSKLEIESISLFNTGPVNEEEWYKIAEFKLGE